MGVWDFVGGVLQAAGVAIQQGAAFAANAGAALIKAAVHGVVGGAMAVAQGGEFLQGFAANAIGAIGGSIGMGAFGDVGGFEGLAGRTAMASIAGCGAASLSGGKCANGAVTAGFAHLFNAERWGRQTTLEGGSGGGSFGGIGLGAIISKWLSSQFAPADVGSGGRPNDPLYDLYRAVSSEELADITSCRCFRQGPNSYEGKLFAENLDGARFFRNRFEDLSHIVSATINKDVYDQLYSFKDLARSR